MKLTKRQLTLDLNETTALQDLMTAYEEIAAVRMKRIREQVLKSRDFHAILSHYFSIIRKTPSITQTASIKHPLAVLFSDNKGLYGDILGKTSDAFIAFARMHPEAKLAVIGTLDSQRLQDKLSGHDLTIFSLPPGTATIQKMEQLLELLHNFPSVTIFHGSFVSLINQEVKESHITGDEIAGEHEKDMVREYLLEPTQEELQTFFQKEILILLFDQALLEGTLSKEASRMISLEKATEETAKRLSHLQRLSRTVATQHRNKEQITYLAGLSLWKIQ